MNAMGSCARPTGPFYLRRDRRIAHVGPFLPREVLDRDRQTHGQSRFVPVLLDAGTKLAGRTAMGEHCPEAPMGWRSLNRWTATFLPS